MIGTITKIDQPKLASDGQNAYYRIYFKLENGAWAQTDVVPRFRNFKFWKPIIESGIDTIVGNLVIKLGYADKIDADCRPYIAKPKLIEPKQDKLL